MSLSLLAGADTQAMSTHIANFVADFVGLEATWPFHALSMLVVATVVVLVFVTPAGLAGIYLERKIAGRAQNRVGPNRVGPYGLLQTLADGVKLLTKEDYIKPGTDEPLFRFAPYIVFLSVFAGICVMPFAPGLTPANLDVGLFFFLAMIGIETIGIVMAGWASNNKWSLLGAMREVAQVISYEIPLGLSAMVPVIAAGSLSLVDLTDYQQGPIWNWFIIRNGYYAIVGIPAFLVFFVSGLAACKRAPFDLPEAESELVAGFHTEYSGMRFGMFFLPEYVLMLTVACVSTVLFLGGYHDPFGLSAEGGMFHGVMWWGFAWFMGKSIVLWLLVMQLRWTLPRLRIDQVMYLCYKVLLPISLVLILLVAALKLIEGAN